jgi:phosphate/sulfate permease
MITLPLGYTLGTLLNVFVLWFLFKKEIPCWDKNVVSNTVHSFCSSVFGAFVTYLALNLFDNFFNLDKTFGVFAQGFLSGLLGLFTMIIFLKLLRSSILEETIQSLKRIFHKKPTTISSDFVEGQSL